MANTEAIRKALPAIIEKFSIQTMLDCPCGDYNWMKSVPKKCRYIGGDIVAELVAENQKNYTSDGVEFRVLNIVSDAIPQVDLIFCRDCLQHLTHANALKVLLNFYNSGSKYLLTTSYPRTWINFDTVDGGGNDLNLKIAPINLPEPLLKIKETVLTGNQPDKTMLLYDLRTLDKWAATKNEIKKA